jgi:hypothetical protein
MWWPVVAQFVPPEDPFEMAAAIGKLAASAGCSAGWVLPVDFLC